MRRRPASQSSMSLFPFLDTLVCTMGALILMLLAMTPKIKEKALARQAAIESASEPAAAPEEEPVAEPEAPAVAAPAAVPEEDHTAERQRRRQSWLEKAANSRNTLADRQADYHLRRQQLKDAEQELRGLHDQILKTQLKSENANQASESLDDRLERLEAQAAVVAQRIAATRKNIDLAQRRQATAKNEYALVAYDGTSGTVRRPIYIECTGQGFRFLPEDVSVRMGDLEGFSNRFNPLQAGAQALIRFWSRRHRTGGPAEPEPYLLLVVRPSGSLNYYRARDFLSTLGAPWGYELIEEDWKLSVPEPDPVAKTMLQETLEATAQVRRPASHDVVIGARDFGGPHDARDGDRDGGFSGRGGGGGREEDEFGSSFGRSGQRGGTGGARKPSLRQGYATRNDRLADDPLLDDVPASGPGRRSGPPGAGAGAGSPGGGSGETLPGGGSGAVKAAGGMAGGPGAAGSRSGGTHTAGIGGGRAGTASDAMGAGSTDGDSSGEHAGDGTPGGGDRTQASRGTAKRPGGVGTGSRARPASLGGNSEADGAGDGDASDESFPGSAIGDDDPLAASAVRGGGKSGKSSASAGSPGSAADAPLGEPGSDGADSSAASGAETGAPNRKTGDTTAQPAKSSWLSDPADGASGGTGRDVKMGGPGATFNLGSKKRRSPKQDEDADGPRISESNSRSRDGSSARSQAPRKWGQTGRRPGIGFEKKIKIYLNDKRIIVDSKEYIIPVGPADSNEEIVNRVASTIDRVADSWGEPPSNFYWVPIVQFIVYPGGNANYSRLQTALDQKWGVKSTVEFPADAKTKKAASGGHP